MIKDSLGDRMKHNYEEVYKARLVRRMPVVIRLDGVAFHTFTRGFDKPFDKLMIKTMQQTMKYLCEHVQGCVFGYTQSDEITLVLIDYAKLESSAWFDYEVQKLVSVAASMATFAFNKFFNRYCNVGESGELKETDSNDSVQVAHQKAVRMGATFDARCFNVPKEEVVNCVLWRQKDAERNSVNSLAQHTFSHKELQGLSLVQTKEKMSVEAGVDWEALPTHLKLGSSCIKKDSCWVIDENMPRLIGEDRHYLEDLINVGN